MINIFFIIGNIPTSIKTIVTVRGISLNYIEQQFDSRFKEYFLKTVKKYINQNLINKDKDIYTTTESGRFLADGIASELFMIDLTD